MQTTQTPNRVSTGFSHRLLPLCLMILVVAIIGFVIYFLRKNDYVPKEYDNADQIITLAENNLEEFISFLNVIDNNSAFGEIFDKNGRIDIFDYRDLKRYMSEDDYTIVCNFWMKYKPRHMRSGAVNFWTSSCHEVSIFISDSPEYLNNKGQFGEVRKLNNNIYCLIYNNNN